MTYTRNYVERIRNSLFGIEVLEIVQQEKTAFGAVVVLLSEPKAVILKFQFDRAAGGVRIFLAVALGYNLRQEPLVDVGRKFAVFGEVCSLDRNPVRAERFFHHAPHVAAPLAVRGIASAASAATEVVARGVHRVVEVEVLGAVCVRGRHRGIAPVRRRLDVAVALFAMEPVEHHHGEFLDRAIAEDARVFPTGFRMTKALSSGMNPVTFSLHFNCLLQTYYVLLIIF